MSRIAVGLEAAYRDHVQARLDAWRTLLQRFAFDAVLVAAGSEQGCFQDDQHLPFKVNPWFKCWLPLLDRPGCYLWISADGAQPWLFYHQPDDIWHKVEPLADEQVERAFHVVILSQPSEVSGHLPVNVRAAYIGPAADCPADCLVRNPQALLTALDYSRGFKSDYELGCMELASKRAVAGHRAAERLFAEGASEFDIHLAYLRSSGHLEEELPYANIIALNEHAAVLHYVQKRRQPPVAHQSLLIDAGASVAGYAADITRTYAAQNDFAALLGAMDCLQQSIVAAVKPGASFVDLHLTTHTRLARLMADVGLLDCTPEQALEEGLTRLFFPHGLGHLLGLQVHDRGGWLQSAAGDPLAPPPEHPFLRLTRTIEEGQVFTIEPGLYFIPSLLYPVQKEPRSALLNWTLIEHWLPCGGIRIEDNIAVTANGVRNLTREAFATE